MRGGGPITISLSCLPDKCEQRAFYQFCGDPVRRRHISPWRAQSSTQQMQQTCYRAAQRKHETTGIVNNNNIMGGAVKEKF